MVIYYLFILGNKSKNTYICNMIIKSDIIQVNIDKVEKAKKDFSILNDYASTNNDTVLRHLWDEGRAYGLLSYMNFIDFTRNTKNLNLDVFY